MRWRQPAADVDVLHQTLAGRHEAACGFGGDWPVRSSCLSEYGSTIDQLAGHEPKVAGKLFSPIKLPPIFSEDLSSGLWLDIYGSR